LLYFAHIKLVVYRSLARFGRESVIRTSIRADTDRFGKLIEVEANRTRTPVRGRS
jgi:hypothetical protein